jgi:hypothetical protein
MNAQIVPQTKHKPKAVLELDSGDVVQDCKYTELIIMVKMVNSRLHVFYCN